MCEPPRWASVDEGETVEWVGRPSPIPPLWTTLKALAVGGVGLGIWLAGEGYLAVGPSMPSSAPATLLGSLLVGVGVMGAITPLVGWVGVGYLVTDEAVYRKRGLLFRSVVSRSLAQVQDVTTSQTLLGKLGSFGDVRVETTTDEAALVLRHVPAPDTVAASVTGR